ncbi:MAG: HupE/UreJ family protein [Sulfurovaceae bacterium]|jgi:urease accessory protein
MKKFLILGALLSSFASAHTSMLEHGGFMSGMAHPISGLDHILAMIGVGILAFFASKKGYLALVGFMGAMVLAALIGKSGVTIPYVEEGILLSIAVVFALIGYAKNISTGIIVAIVAFFGAFHGYAHGAEFTVGNFALYMLGFSLSTLALHLTGMVGAYLYSKKAQVATAN